MSRKSNNSNNKGNSKQSVQSSADQQQIGMQQMGKSKSSGMQSGNKINTLGQGTVAGSTGTKNQGNAGK
jgi:hypothetical protein